MADISKCTGTSCPIKEGCYRYVVPENEFRQAYFGNNPFNHTTMECEYHWPIEITK